MNFKNILAAALFALIIIGGPAYVLFVKDPPQQAKTETKQENSTQKKEEPQQPEQPAFDRNKYSYDDPTSIWVVSNKSRPLNPKNYTPGDLVSVGGGQQLRKEAADSLSKLIAAARADGLSISPLSGYRSYNTQVAVYNKEVKTYGQAVADTQSARPGTSEHQTGLSIDVGGGGCGIEDCFATTSEGKWVAANVYKYGFIIRYPEGKQAITGYRYEPWHIRYVGVELATEMHNKGIQTLEEFFSLPAAPSYPN